MYESKSLNVLVYDNGFTLWHYDAKGEDLTVPHYFDAANDDYVVIKSGDIIVWSDKSGARGGQLLASVAVKGRVIVTPLTVARPTVMA